MAWMYGQSRAEINFPEVESGEEVQFLVPAIRFVSREEKAHLRTEAYQRTEERGVLYMAKFVEANLDLVGVELEFFAKKEKERRMKEDEEVD